jgi:hypothetical protein
MPASISFRILAASLLATSLFAGCAHKPLVPPTIVSAAEWDSKPQEFPESFRHTPNKVLLHHAGELWKADTEPEVKLRNLQSWGQRDKNWKDVPYHYFIAPDGRIFEGRSVSYKPDTNTKFDPTGYINVMFWGNFEEQRITEAELASTVAVTAMLIDRYKLTIDDFTTHMDVAPGQTTCPGKDFYQYIETGLFREWVAASLKGKTPNVRLLPPLEGGPTEMVPQ